MILPSGCTGKAQFCAIPLYQKKLLQAVELVLQVIFHKLRGMLKRFHLIHLMDINPWSQRVRDLDLLWVLAPRWIPWLVGHSALAPFGVLHGLLVTHPGASLPDARIDLDLCHRCRVIDPC